MSILLRAFAIHARKVLFSMQVHLIVGADYEWLLLEYGVERQIFALRVVNRFAPIRWELHTSLTFFMLDTCFQSNTETQ